MPARAIRARRKTPVVLAKPAKSGRSVKPIKLAKSTSARSLRTVSAGDGRKGGVTVKPSPKSASPGRGSGVKRAVTKAAPKRGAAGGKPVSVVRERRHGVTASLVARVASAERSAEAGVLGRLEAGATVSLPTGYRPSADEPYMCSQQLEYFRMRLRSMGSELTSGLDQGVTIPAPSSQDVGDDADRADEASRHALTLQDRVRQRSMLNAVDAALRRIEVGGYGYCDESGEPIGLARLEARPTATFSIDVQERLEREHRQIRTAV